MITPPKNKMITGKDENTKSARPALDPANEVKPEKKSFWFPQQQVVVEAESQEEAEKKVQEIINNKV